jgi:hypothetical protein
MREDLTTAEGLLTLLELPGIGSKSALTLSRKSRDRAGLQRSTNAELLDLGLCQKQVAP